MSAFEPEWTALKTMLSGRKDHVVNGTIFATGTIEHQPVVLFLSGISMVNAAMSTQLALDRFTIKMIVFSGIAGGVDPDLEIGDVVVPDERSQYLEAVFAREKAGSYTLPGYAEKPLRNFGMMFPQPVRIAMGGHEPEKRFWFPVMGTFFQLASDNSAAFVREFLKRLPRRVASAMGCNSISESDCGFR
jgi:adenosylhomocysteine nucleosidase